MFKSTQEFDSAVKTVLLKIRDGEDLSSFPSDDDSLEAIAESIDRRFLQGVSYERDSNGKPHFQKINSRLTYNGLKFIE